MACQNKKMNDFEALTVTLREFRDARDWKQFHTLRNLITSLNLEAAELLELTQWKSDTEVAALPADADSHQALSDECAATSMSAEPTHCFNGLSFVLTTGMGDVLGHNQTLN